MDCQNCFELGRMECPTHGPEAQEDFAKDLKEFKEKRDALRLVVLYAQDIVDMWPTVTLRTLGRVTEKITSLKEALDKSKGAKI